MSNPNFSITRANLIRYASANPIEFSMLKGYTDMDLSHWTQAQQEAYFDWSEAQASRATSRSTSRTGYVDDGDALSQYTARSEIDRVLVEFGEEPEWFGPGSYKGGYTGHGDTIYWGPQDGSSSSSAASTDLSSEFHSSVSSRSQMSNPDSFTTNRSVVPRAGSAGVLEFPEGGPSTATGSSMPSISEEFGGETYGPGGETRIGEISYTEEFLPLHPGQTPGETIAVGGRDLPLHPGQTPGGGQTPGETIAHMTPGEASIEITPGERMFAQEVSETAASFQDMYLPDETGLLELPENLVGVQNHITPFETAGANKWNMGTEMHSQEFVSSLDSLPEVPELDAAMLTKLGINKADMGKILNDSFIETNASGVGSYNLNRFVNGIAGAALNVFVIGPLLNWVRDNLGVVGQGIYGVVNIYGAAQMFGLIGDFDPIGLAVQLALVGITAFNDQSRRVRDNDYSGKLDSSRTMMVKDQGKWYPAFLVNRTESEGLLFPGTDMIEVRYGRPEDLYFVHEAGITKAFFKHQKNRQFRMDPETWNTDRGSYEWMKEKDPLRGFYFLDPEETEDLLQGYGTKDFAWKILDDTASELNSEGGIGNKMIELQAALDFIQNSQRKAGSPDEYMVSPTRGLQRAFSVRRAGGHFGVITKWEQPPDVYEHQYMEWKTNGLTELARKILPENMLTLEDYRRTASDSVGGLWWKAYADNEKDIPMATTFDELKAQYDLIDGYHDRNVAQKDYLKQKAGVRYQMSVVNQMNVGYDLYDELNKQAYSYSDMGSDIHHKLYYDRSLYLAQEGGLDGDLLYSSTHWGLFPINSMWTEDAGYDYANVGEGTRKANMGLRQIPSWYNKGDGLLPVGMDLGEYNNAETGWDDWAGNNKTALENWVTENGDWSKEIAEAGAKTNDAYIIKSYYETLDDDAYQDTLEKMNRDGEAAAEAAAEAAKDPFFKFAQAAEAAKDSPAEQARRLENTYFTKHRYERIFKTGKWLVIKGKRKQPRRSQRLAWQIKQDRKYKPRNSKQLKDARLQQAYDDADQEKLEKEHIARTQQLDREEAEIHKKMTGLKSSKDFTTHFVSGDLKGQEITYERWKQQAANFFFEPLNVGETSWQHAAESILFSDAWIPKDVPLSEENFPSYWVDSHDEWDLWKPLLEHIDKIDDPAMKQRANYIHNIIGQKETQQYLKRFHPHQTMDNNTIGKDLAGTHAILSDDWSLPYKPDMNSVMFNHEIQSQLDVGVVETY